LLSTVKALSRFARSNAHLIWKSEGTAWRTPKFVRMTKFIFWKLSKERSKLCRPPRFPQEAPLPEKVREYLPAFPFAQAQHLENN
jgi:hypothetical protein